MPAKRNEHAEGVENGAKHLLLALLIPRSHLEPDR